MYGALFVAYLALLCWPDRNVFDVPFAELTLKMLAGTALAAWLAYHAAKLAFASLEKDTFWPWRWTARIFCILCIRLAFLTVFASGFYAAFSSARIAHLMIEHPILTGIALLGIVTMIVCVDDDEMLAPHILNKGAGKV